MAPTIWRRGSRSGEWNHFHIFFFFMNWGPLCLLSPKLTFHMAELFYLRRYIHFLKMEIRYIRIFSGEVSQFFMVFFSWRKATLIDDIKNLDSALLYKVVIVFFFSLFTVKTHHNHDFRIQLAHYENWNDLLSWERYLWCRRVCDIYWTLDNRKVP